METNKFDDIRPYCDSEVNNAMQRIADSVSFPLLASFVYPNVNTETVKKQICQYNNIRDFQHEVMYEVNRQVIKRSITEFTCNGLDRLSPDEAYLYVSNHRDIMLDSSLLQYFLVKNGFETSEITFGANLMINQLVVDIGKSNKMFKVERPGGSVKEFYRSSMHLSDYIRHTITEKRESVWIAQRNGRTKDGNDRTDQGIIKMFCMSKKDDKIAAINDLHIVPIAISYEWESCDVLKTLEVYQSRFSKYTKKPGEDLNSVLTGIMAPKGHVHIELCRPITRADLEHIENYTANDYHKAVADIITRRIIEGYRLMPTNYIAYDIRHACSKFRSEYTDVQKNEFEARLQSLSDFDSCNVDELQNIFLGIYSNSVENKLALNDLS